VKDHPRGGFALEGVVATTEDFKKVDQETFSKL
jgi:hypothetical protein